MHHRRLAYGVSNVPVLTHRHLFAIRHDLRCGYMYATCECKAQHTIAELSYGETPLAMHELKHVVDAVITRRVQGPYAC